MASIDWIIVATCGIALAVFSLYTSRFMTGVADFLAANRTGGRYMMSLAGMSGLGAISAIALYEMYYKAGLPPVWWNLMSIPVTVIITLSGWVYYRYRETRVLTLAQLFEVRYSRKFRIYSGMITWLCGLVNF